MFELGTKQTLEAVKAASPGVYLAVPGDSSGEKVLLPKNQVPEDLTAGDTIEVFLYKDSEDRLIATTTTPKITLGEVAALKVKEISEIGAFLDWGLAKDLLVPFREQIRPLREHENVLVALYIDKSSRLCATTKIYEYLRTDSPYKKDDSVFGTIYECSDEFGVFVAVDNKYSALVPRKEVYHAFRIGDTLEARVTEVKPDGKLDLSLRQKTFLQLDEDSLLIYRKLLAAGGFLPFHDKSDPEDIKQAFQLSKNAFKRAIGHLMKDEKIRITDKGIEALHGDQKTN